jgi:hypothetical protein
MHFGSGGTIHIGFNTDAKVSPIYELHGFVGRREPIEPRLRKAPTFPLSQRVSDL